MSHLYLVDLDRTLFDTTRFGHDLITTVEQVFDLEPATFRHDISRYLHPQEVGYDFYAHATAVTGLPEDEIADIVRQHLPVADYLYPDATTWLQARLATPGDTVCVITVGLSNYQGLKFAVSPALKTLPKRVVSQNKGTLIRASLTTDPNVLDLGEVLEPSPDASSDAQPHITIIDDNPATFEHFGTVPGATTIYMSRIGEKYAGQAVPASTRTVTSFGDLS